MEELRLVPLDAYNIDCRLLEVEPGASLEEIKQAYRDQTKVWHPDRFANDVRLQKKAEAKIKEINLAYRRLCGLSPYEHRVSIPAVPGASSGRIAVFALRQALREGVILVARPFQLFLRKGIDISNGVFQWCRRERRSLAIATSAFVLGLAFGVWLLPRESETWVKISSVLQRPKENMGTAQPPVAQAPAAAPTVPPQTGLLATSSPETEGSTPPQYFGTNSSPPVTRASVNASPWETNVVTTNFSVGEQQVSGKTPAHYHSVWEKHWLKAFGHVSDAELMMRDNYIPVSLAPHHNPFYLGLPYNDVGQGQFKPEEPNVVPSSKQIYAEPGRVTAQQQSHETIRKKAAHPATVETSHVSTPPNESGMSPSQSTPEKESSQQKKPASPAATKSIQDHHLPTETAMRGPAKALKIYAPRPGYPEEARSHPVPGSGVCVVSVDPVTGRVTNASMAQSTGSPDLDKSALRTLRSWQFKPGTAPSVSVPFEFITDEGKR
jgi:TonB family protein